MRVQLCVYNNIVLTKPLESGLDVGQGINIGHGKFGKNIKRRALNKHRAWKICKYNKHIT